MRILIADDEAPARFLLRSCLEDEGFSGEDMLEVRDGMELLAALPEFKPRICFVDIRMPGVDGLEALKRAQPLAPGSVWVIVSSHAEFEYARSALRLGATEYLLKPVDPQDLRACLGRLRLLPSSPEQDPVISRIIEQAERSFNADISLADLAEQIGLTPNYLSAYFHKKMGQTFMAYLLRLRMTEARKLLLSGVSVGEASKAVGYADTRHFSRKYHEVLGEYPSDCRAEGRS